MPRSSGNTPPADAPKRSPRRRSGEEVVARLKDAATAEFEVNGYSRAKTAAIAQKAGVSETLLFKHFGSKANLFNDAIFNPIEQHFAAFSDQHAADGEGGRSRDSISGEYIAEMQAFFGEHAGAILLLVMSQAFESDEVNGIDKVAGLHRYLERTSTMVRERLAGQPRVDPRLVACVSFAAIMSCEIFRDWLFPEGWGSEQEIHDAVVTFVLGGFNASIAPR